MRRVRAMCSAAPSSRRCLKAPEGGLEEALAYANAGRGLEICRAPGARPGSSDPKEVEQLLAAQSHM